MPKIATPHRYGMEYEIQVMIHDTVLNTWDTLHVSDLRYNTKSEGLQEKYQSVPQGRTKLTLRISRDDFTKLRPWCSEDMGNIEIRNEFPLPTIDACLQQLNKRVDELGTLLTKSLPVRCRFALMLPEPKLIYMTDCNQNPIPNFGLSCMYVKCTKHLNISYGTQSELCQNSALLLKCFNAGVHEACNYLHIVEHNSCSPRAKDGPVYSYNSFLTYKASSYISIDTKFILTLEGCHMWDPIPLPKHFSKFEEAKTHSTRVEIKLPYGFSNYEKLFACEMKLEDYQDYKPILLGHSSKHILRGVRPWIRKSALV